MFLFQLYQLRYLDMSKRHGPSNFLPMVLLDCTLYSMIRTFLGAYTFGFCTAVLVNLIGIQPLFQVAKLVLKVIISFISSCIGAMQSSFKVFRRLAIRNLDLLNEIGQYTERIVLK